MTTIAKSGVKRAVRATVNVVKQAAVETVKLTPEQESLQERAVAYITRLVQHFGGKRVGVAAAGGMVMLRSQGFSLDKAPEGGPVAADGKSLSYYHFLYRTLPSKGIHVVQMSDVPLVRNGKPVIRSGKPVTFRDDVVIGIGPEAEAEAQRIRDERAKAHLERRLKESAAAVQF